MANREAFIDFVHGLLNINPLERWTPQQARTHPFITQQKFTGPFQPQAQMSLKNSSRSPAPGVQQQQQAEALSRQRAQQAQAAQQQQSANAAYANAMHGMNPGYPMTPQAAQQQQQQQAAMYSNMYSPSHQGAPPPYPSNPPSASAYGQQVPMIQQPPPAAGMHPYAQQQQPNLYTQATTRAAAGRHRASTMDGNGIPPALQRVVSHLDPSQPIRLQPSPAYYPPPAEGQSASDVGSIGRRRTSRAGGTSRHAAQGQDRNFVRMLEDRSLEEGWNGQSAQGGGWNGSGV